jgi:hypothetical protein
MLHAATTATSSLKKIHLKHIPVCNSKYIQELSFEACKSASDVSLDYGNRGTWFVPTLQHVVQLGAVLSQNPALTSLHFTIQGQPSDGYRLNCLTYALTGLQSLSLSVGVGFKSAPCCGIPPIQHMLCLTHLQLGGGLNLMSLPQILPHLTRLKAIHLFCGWLAQLPPLTPLTALQTLSLSGCHGLQQLPPLTTLTALRTLTLVGCEHLQEMPPLATLTALQTFSVQGALHLHHLPPLATLTALQTLALTKCCGLRQLPPLATLSLLQKLHLASERLQKVPSLKHLLHCRHLCLVTAIFYGGCHPWSH